MSMIDRVLAVKCHYHKRGAGQPCERDVLDDMGRVVRYVCEMRLREAFE